MKLTASTRIKDVQKEFSELYPGLKLEFYKKAHKSFEGSFEKDILDSNHTIAEISNMDSDHTLSISPEMSVAQLENEFEERFGLHVQVFRRSKELWLQTSTTDDWSLEKQNRKGEHSLLDNLSLYEKS